MLYKPAFYIKELYSDLRLLLLRVIILRSILLINRINKAIRTFTIKTEKKA